MLTYTDGIEAAKWEMGSGWQGAGGAAKGAYSSHKRRHTEPKAGALHLLCE